MDFTYDVAVHQPDARIVGLEGHCEITASGQQGDISSWWVLEVKTIQSVGDIKTSIALVENDKVMTVHVDWVGRGDV